MAWQMPTSSSDWKELRLRLSRSSPQTIGYRPKLFNAELGLANPNELLTVVLLYRALGGGWQQ